MFGADSQLTAGVVRTTGAVKIRKLGDSILWGASGEIALIQRVEESLARLQQRDQPLSLLRDSLCLIVKHEVEELLKLDFRTQFVSSNPDSLLNLHQGDFLFVEHHDTPRILHILANGTPEWIDGFAATGNGNLFAHALLNKYSGHLPLDSDITKLICFKTISEAIDVGAYGLGNPIDMWEASSTGVSQISEEQMASILDTSRLLREREVALLDDMTRKEPEPESEPLAADPQTEE